MSDRKEATWGLFPRKMEPGELATYAIIGPVSQVRTFHMPDNEQLSELLDDLKAAGESLSTESLPVGALFYGPIPDPPDELIELAKTRIAESVE